MKLQCFTVIFLATFLLGIEGEPTVRHKTRYLKTKVRKKLNLKNQYSRLNFQTLSKKSTKQIPAQKRQSPFHVSDVQHVFEGTSPVTSYQNFRDTENSMDFRQPAPHDNYRDSSPEGPTTSQFSQGLQQRVPNQNPSTLSSDGLLNPRMVEQFFPRPLHVFRDSFTNYEAPSHDTPISFPQGQQLKGLDEDYSVVNNGAPINIHVAKKFYPVEIVYKVPRPVMVTHTKLVPFPVNRKTYRYYPHPFPQPFSRNPDVDVSFLHLEGRGEVNMRVNSRARGQRELRPSR